MQNNKHRGQAMHRIMLGFAATSCLSLMACTTTPNLDSKFSSASQLNKQNQVINPAPNSTNPSAIGTVEVRSAYENYIRGAAAQPTLNAPVTSSSSAGGGGSK